MAATTGPSVCYVRLLCPLSERTMTFRAYICTFLNGPLRSRAPQSVCVGNRYLMTLGALYDVDMSGDWWNVRQMSFRFAPDWP